MATAFWWQGSDSLGHVANLGDQLNPLLLNHYGIDVTWAPVADADIIACGSVIDHLPRSGWTGIIAGAGQLQRSTTTDLSDATVLGVRGPLTRNRIRTSNVPIVGDPGLLAPMLVPTPHKTHEVGIIAHWSDKDLVNRELWRARKVGYPVTVINVADDPLDVIIAIGSCRKIVSSALHGIIIADAWGIPRRAEVFPAMRTNPHEGGFMKFDDYASSIGQPIHFGHLQQAPHGRIMQMQSDLTAMFQQVKEIHAPAQSR